MFGLSPKSDSQIVFRDSPLTEALRRGDFAIIFHWFFRCFVGAAIAGFVLLLAVGVMTTDSKLALRAVAISLFFAAACTVSGWLLGLLFGIPRTLARPQPIAATIAPASGGGTDASGKENVTAPATVTPAVASRVNTNLEDISDWLTKTLVGVGLTQLYFVPHYLWQSANKISVAARLEDHGGQTLILALFLYFAPAGFWLGYVGTRTILTKLFDEVERPPAAAINATLAPDALKIDPQGKLDKATTAEVKAADAALLKFPMTALSTPRELAAWGIANARNNNLDSAAVALQEATRADPSDPLFKQALAKVYTAQSRNDAALQVLQGDNDSEVALFNALYEAPPGGFTKAIEIGTRLAQRPGADANLNLHIWLASAYGQQHAYAIKTDNSELAAQARSNAIKEVEAALKISTMIAKPLLRGLWQATPGTADDDLSSIRKDDPDLSRLLL